MRIVKIKPYIIQITVVLLLILIANYMGYKTALKRQRDIQRVLDIGYLQQALIAYKADFGHYPLSSEGGKIIACRGIDTKPERDSRGNVVNNGFKKANILNLVPCQWGEDALLDALDLNYPAYLSLIPKDPAADRGFTYVYRSDGNGFVLLAHLELTEQKDYSKTVLEKKITCGSYYCNMMRAQGGEIAL